VVPIFLLELDPSNFNELAKYYQREVANEDSDNLKQSDNIDLEEDDYLESTENFSDD